MDRKLLKKLNKKMLECGRAPNGQPRFKWDRASNHFYIHATGETEEVVDPETGLPYVRYVYARHSYADKNPPSFGYDAWALWKWTSPKMGRERWERVYSGEFPYPANGQYEPIENTRLAEGNEPTEEFNDYTVFKLKEHLSLSLEDHHRLVEQQAADDFEAEKREFGDKLDDTLHTPYPTILQPGVAHPIYKANPRRIIIPE